MSDDDSNINLPDLTSTPKCMLYIVQAGKNGPIKIGIARNLKSRLKALQTANADVLTVLGIKVMESRNAAFGQEAFLHRALANRRLHIRGEWFKFRAIDRLVMTRQDIDWRAPYVIQMVERLRIGRAKASVERSDKKKAKKAAMNAERASRRDAKLAAAREAIVTLGLQPVE